MAEINRSLIILKPKQPFLDWARTLDDEDKDFTLEKLREDSTTYLLPEVWDYDEHQKLLEPCYDILFEEELEGWWADETAWPKERDLKMFFDWFDVEFHSLVFDLCDEPTSVVEDEENNSPTETSH